MSFYKGTVNRACSRRLHSQRDPIEELPMQTKPPIRDSLSRVLLSEDHLVITIGKVDRYGAFFFAVFAVPFTLATAILIVAGLTQGKLEFLLYSIPFAAASIAVDAGLFASLFYRERMELSPQGFTGETRLFRLSGIKRTPLGEIRSIQVKQTGINDNKPCFAIEVQTWGTSQFLGVTLEQAERESVAQCLEAHRTRLQEEAQLPSLPDGDLSDARGLAPPFDHRWTCHEEPGSVRFTQTGKIRLGRFFSFLIANMFLNGLLIAAAVAFHGRKFPFPPPLGPISANLLLLGFAPPSLFVLKGFVRELFEPLRESSWRFVPGEIIQERRYVPFSRSEKRLPQFDGPLSAHLVDQRPTVLNEKHTMLEINGEQFALQLETTNKLPVAQIEHLTLGEALWIKGILQAKGFATVHATRQTPTIP